ncbi:Glycosyl_transferase family 2 protein [Hexamita inflata]|uniref:Glycosyl transferase family 2 protein n=1 Tax=Hexamita inflata TaxID=28002 RepID=A0AA86PGV4_9EUKA|nr:Glycosyl transferase family 2 protein [Hexamita inflata]
MNQPAVSIITPAYNAGYCIARAISTALAQTYQNWNMIIVNDGSTDDTAEIIGTFTQTNSNIKLITLPRNRGVFYARTLAVKFASEFVVFLDADDELTPNALEEAVKKQQQQDVDIVHSSCVLVQDHNGVRNNGRDMNVLFGDKLEGKEVLEAYAKAQGVLFMLWTKLFKRSILEHAIKKLNIIAANRLNYAEDILLCAAMLTKPGVTIAGTSNIGYIYHFNPISLTNQPRTEEKIYDMVYMFHFTKKCALRYALELQQKYGVTLDFYFPNEHFFKMVEVPTLKSIRQQITFLQIWTSPGMFNSGPAHIQTLKNMWNEKVFSRCSFIDNCWQQINGDEVIQNSEILMGGKVELWNVQNSEEIYNNKMSFNQTIELIDYIWDQKEAGVEVHKETEDKYGSWYNNYLKIIDQI